jgi:hypothetical protein
VGGLDAVAVVDGECVEDGLPAVDLAGWVGAVGSPFGGDEVEDLQCRLFGGEVSAVTDRLAEPGIERLDGVGIRYDISDVFDAGAGSWF